MGQAFCGSCQTRLSVVTLYAPSLEDWAGPQKNRLVGDRYRWCGRGVFVDHKPGLVPDAPDEVPTGIAVYLRLFEQRPQVPIPYGQVQVDGRSRLLLEDAPVTLTGEMRLPDIRQEWSQATTLRQLNWLWQIAMLWDPLQRLQCEGTLLNAQKIRIEGSWVRLLSLDYQPSNRPLKAADLVREWLAWSSKSRAPLKQGLTQLLGQLMEEGHSSGTAIAQILKNWIVEWSAGQPPCNSTVAAFTDLGPSRDRNEDACYPPSSSGTTAPGDRTLAIVCDGLGGHDSGEVASMLAIQTIQTKLGQHLTRRTGAPSSMDRSATRGTYTETLRESFLDANGQISAQNDKEAREERQRMGTTAVVTLQQGRLLYSASLGDSRIYRITAHNCYQITTDDDLASREVRLGYGFYRDISQAPTGGALVQALGMGSSEYLSPGIRPLVLDEDCIFLLCSDGVSDFDFVERYWRDIYGYVSQGQSLDQVAQNIVRLANQVNGHDNATAALVQVQGHLEQLHETDVPLTLPAAIAPPSGSTNINNPFVEPANAVAPDTTTTTSVSGRSPTSHTPTQLPQPAPKSGRSPLVIAVVLIAAGLLAALLWPSLRNLIEANRSTAPADTSETSPSPPAADPNAAAASPFSTNSIVQTIAPLPGTTTLRRRPRMDAGSTINLSTNQYLLIVEVTNAQDSTDLSAESWLKVSICGAIAVDNPNVVVEREPPVSGWIERSVLTAIAQPIADPDPAVTEACTYAQPQSSPPSTPTLAP